MIEREDDNQKGGSLLRYKIDTFIAKGGGSIFIALVAVFLIVFIFIAVSRALFFFFNPEIASQYNDLGFLGHIYIAFLQLTDPGNMSQDILSSPGYKVFSVLAGIAGIVLLSALIAFITTTFDQKISELKRGRSKVIEQGHTLLLGWNEQRVIEIIRELQIANESEDDACLVILADKDKEEMDDIIKLRSDKSKNTRIITRSGKVATLANLDMVSIDDCDSLIIMASCSDTDGAEEKNSSDAAVIQTILAISKNSHFDNDFAVVAEIFNEAYRQIINESFNDFVVTVNTSDILAKLLVQTSRSVGLSTVYSEILSFDGCEMYFHNDDWQARKFHELVYFFPDGVPMGVRQENGTLILNPGTDYQMKDSDEILIVADDDSTIELLEKPVAKSKQYPLADKKFSQKQERELIIGWNHKSKTIISEFSDYVIDGSEIDILLSNASDEMRSEIIKLDNEIENVKISLIEKNHLSESDLITVEPFKYDNIILLANEEDGIKPDRVDAENIVCLLLLRNIFKKHDKTQSKTKMITEVLDSQNHELVSEAGVKDVIISNRLVSMIMSQLSENKNIKDVYDDIFEEDGSEIYLKPVSLYFDDIPATLSFADLIEIAQKRKEVCIGIKIKADEDNFQKNQGVQLIPDKNAEFSLSADDCLVVLSEDEL